MKKVKVIDFICLVLIASIVWPWPILASEEATDHADLAKKTLNPVSALISVPVQFNYDSDMGPRDEGEKIVVNIQPVIPISMGPDWNLISRTIIPIVDQEDILPGGLADESGIGDIFQSLFFSPKEPTSRGWIWGAGPALLIPTASDDLLGGEKWGLGPTAVLLKQEHGFTYGALANHIWSVAGDDDRSDISATFLQPFFSFTTKTFTSFTINTESTYDWETEEWSVPVHLLVSQILKIGQQPISLQVGARYWAESTDSGPEGWGLRASIKFLFPK